MDDFRWVDGFVRGKRMRCRKDLLAIKTAVLTNTAVEEKIRKMLDEVGEPRKWDWREISKLSDDKIAELHLVAADVVSDMTYQEMMEFLITK